MDFHVTEYEKFTDGFSVFTATNICRVLVQLKKYAQLSEKAIKKYSSLFQIYLCKEGFSSYTSKKIICHNKLTANRDENPANFH